MSVLQFLFSRIPKTISKITISIDGFVTYTLNKMIKVRLEYLHTNFTTGFYYLDILYTPTLPNAQVIIYTICCQQYFLFFSFTFFFQNWHANSFVLKIFCILYHHPFCYMKWNWNIDVDNMSSNYQTNYIVAWVKRKKKKN